jgi:hypothetical protein
MTFLNHFRRTYIQLSVNKKSIQTCATDLFLQGEDCKLEHLESRKPKGKENNVQMEFLLSCQVPHINNSTHSPFKLALNINSFLKLVDFFMYLDFPGANSSPDEEPEDQQWPGWCQVNFFNFST